MITGQMNRLIVTLARSGLTSLLIRNRLFTKRLINRQLV